MKKLLSFALALALMLTVFLVPGLGAQAAQAGELYLHVGSPIALSDGKILAIDQQNPDLVPLIHKDRTLVPLRFVSEFFKAQVSYDEAANAGVVTVGGKKAEFPVGKAYYLLDGTQIALDTETLNVSGRIFLPLRVMCEDVLGLSVDYKDQVIGISAGAALADDQVQQVKAKIGMYVKVSDLASLKQHLASQNPINYSSRDGEAQLEASVAASDAAASDSNSGSGGGYSKTNTQVDGVDEADIIKTDGQYIYLLGGNKLNIVQAGDHMSVVGGLSLGRDRYAQEMYVDGNRLVLIGTRYTGQDGGVYPLTDVMEDVAVDSARSMPVRGKTLTFVSVYDVGNKDAISLLREFEIEGYLTTTRKQGDYVYLLSNLSLWNLEGGDPRPLMGESGVLEPMPVDDIMIMPGLPAESYLTLSAINIQDSGEEISSETIAGSGYTTYMSNKAMYIAMYSGYYSEEETLRIAKFSISDGSIGYAGSGKVAGNLNDQFSMDEHDGYLRLATTVWDESNKNNLYVLDDNMEVCGSSLGFAPDERIYSVRFLGDKGYIVTFKQVDPLFVFDLSDPANPQITGQLKVPGFSSYLHPVGEDMILGVGNDVRDVYVKDKDGKEVVISQQTASLKLSLFDVSDMGKPKEVDTLLLGDQGYSELLYNHKAAMFKYDDGVVAFPAQLYGYDAKADNWSGALVVSYLNNRLVELGRIADKEIEYNYEQDSFYFGQRLVYIGDTLYYAQGNIVRSFDLDTLKEQQQLTLN